MSCSVIKAANRHPVGHYYFAIDFTVSNADKNLLETVNKVVMQSAGVISPIKGAFNLSARGKTRVQMVLDFLGRYPIIIGDLAKNRIALLREALAYLQAHRAELIREASASPGHNLPKAGGRFLTELRTLHHPQSP